MAKAKPDSATNKKYTVLGIIGIAAYLASKIFLPKTPDIFYGQYGAILFGGLCALVAHIKGRNAVAWFAWGIWFVLASFIILLILPKLEDKLCPYCRKGISSEATVCPYCQRDIPITLVEIVETGSPHEEGKDVQRGKIEQIENQIKQKEQQIELLEKKQSRAQTVKRMGKIFNIFFLLLGLTVAIGIITILINRS